MKRVHAINLAKFAGYHGDTKAFTRLCIEAPVSFVRMREAYAAGEDARARGLVCGCSECRGAEKGRAS